MSERRTASDERLIRIRDGAQAVLRRLDAGESLSSVLLQAKAVADECGSKIHSFWLELEIFGLRGGPLREPPFTEPDQKAGGLLFTKLHSVRVSNKGEPWRDRLPERDQVLYDSISDMEQAVGEWGDPWEVIRDEYVNQEQLQALSSQVGLNRERKRVVSDVRANVYDYVAGVRRWADAELENIALLGPDYRIVLDSLEALDSGVREELVAALENLSSPNPAAWAAAALVCRNVVLALGRNLWPATSDEYESQMEGRPLDLKGEREVNRLRAYIDYNWRTSDDEARATLQELCGLARNVYERGSAGKQQGAMTHAGTQELVIDTFRLVAGLRKLTGLRPAGQSGH